MISVIVLFVMDMDEWIFSTLEAISEKWTAHVADSEDARRSSEIEARSGSIIAEMKEEMARQIASQQVEMESKIDEVKEVLNKGIEFLKAQIASYSTGGA
jgi:outer membrane phospholipase A